MFHHSHRQEPLQQVFLTFFQQPEQAQDLCQSPEDWALWFDLVPSHKKEACFNSLFSNSLAMLQPVLAKPCFTDHLARKTAEELRALMNQPLPVPLIAQSLVLMGLDPQSLLKHCSELGEQRRSAFVTLINSPKFFLPLLPQISVKKQYHWLIWAISDILSELLDHTHTPNFEFFCFKPVLSRASFQDIAHLINTHNGGGRALSALISLGTPFATIADALLSLGAEQYHLLWQELQGSLAPGRLSELFACTHQPMSIAERQQLARCLYHTNPERLKGYRSFFEHLNSLEPFHTQHTPFCRYFSHFDSIAQLLHGESFPQHLKSFIVKALMHSECSWLRSLPMTQEQFATISSYLTPEQQNYVRYCVGITSDDERSEPLTSTQSFLLSQKQPPSCDDLFRLWDMLEEGDLTSIHGSSSISSSHSTSPSKKPRY